MVGRAGRRRTSTAAGVVPQPGAQPVRGAGGEGAGRADVLRLALAGARRRPRAGRAGPGRRRSASAGRRPGPPPRTARRTAAAPAAPRARPRRAAAARPSCRRRPGRPARPAGWRPPGRPTGPAQLGLGHDVPGGQDVQPGEHLAGRLGHRSAQAGQRPGDPQRPLDHRVGDGAGPDRLALVHVPLQRGAGHRGAQADLGGDLAAVPAQRAVPQRLVDRVAGRSTAGGDVGERRAAGRAGRSVTLPRVTRPGTDAGRRTGRNGDRHGPRSAGERVRGDAARARTRALGRLSPTPSPGRLASLVHRDAGHPTMRSHGMSETLANLLNETRQFPPPAELAAARQRHRRRVRRGRGRPARLLGAAGRPADLGEGVGPGARLVEPAVREVVRRRRSSTSRTTASTGTSRPGRGDKVAIHWEGEPGDTRTITYADLHALGLPGGQRADRPGRDGRATGSRSTCR